MVVTEPIHRYHQCETEVTVQCDTNDKGLGAAVLQDDQPLAHILTSTEGK